MNVRIVIILVCLGCLFIIFGGREQEATENMTLGPGQEERGKSLNDISFSKKKKKRKVISHRPKLNFKLRNTQVKRYFRERTKHMEEVCARYQDKPRSGHRSKVSIFNLDPRRKLVMCRTAKHGSTSWSNIFFKIYTHNVHGSGTQVDLKKLESQAYTNDRKVGIVATLEKAVHKYLSIVVCRNPVEKLLSVYKVTQDPRAVDPEKYPSRSDFVKKKSWPQFLDLVASSRPNYLGLLNPFNVGCDPCTYHYDAVVKMETFQEDVRFILSKSDLSWLAPSHKNIHGSNSLSSLNLTNLFSNTSSFTISKIISKYEKDFQLCGYEDTLHQLQNLLHQKSSAS